MQTCNANIPVGTVASAEENKPSGPSLEGSIPDSKSPTGLLQAQNTNQTLISLAASSPEEPH